MPGRAVALLTLLWLCGCGPGNVATLRERPHRVYSFEAPAGYEMVYERIVRRARERYRPISPLPHQPGVSTSLFPSTQFATVTLWDSGGIGMRYLLTADIRQIGPARTQVDIYSASSRDDKEARLWQQWAITPLGDFRQNSGAFVKWTVASRDKEDNVIRCRESSGSQCRMQ